MHNLWTFCNENGACKKKKKKHVYVNVLDFRKHLETITVWMIDINKQHIAL